MGEVTLSWLFLIGTPADETFPACVLAEIADAHGIKYDSRKLNETSYLTSLAQLINSSEVPSVPRENHNGEQLGFIARFVNRRCGWELYSLIEAFQNVIRYWDDPDRLFQLPVDTIFECPTSEAPYHTSVIFAFAICHRRKIETSLFTTTKALQLAAKLTLAATDYFRQNALNLIASHFTRRDIINALLLFDMEKEKRLDSEKK
jgi:hypothetical protein